MRITIERCYYIGSTTCISKFEHISVSLPQQLLNNCARGYQSIEQIVKLGIIHGLALFVVI